MRDFICILKRFVHPYKKYMVLNIVFNVLSAILNLFSFALIIPILQILFKMDEGNYTFMDWNFNAGSWESWKALPELIKNNFFWYVSDLIEVHGGSFALIMLGIFLIVATFLKVATMYLAFQEPDPDLDLSGGHDRYQLATYRVRLDPAAVGGLRNGTSRQEVETEVLGRTAAMGIPDEPDRGDIRRTPYYQGL